MKHNNHEIGRLIRAIVSASFDKDPSYEEHKQIAEKLYRMEHYVGPTQFILQRGVIESGGDSIKALPYLPSFESKFEKAGGRIIKLPWVTEANVPRFDGLAGEFIGMTESPLSSQISSVPNANFKPLRGLGIMDIARSILLFDDGTLGQIIIDQMGQKIMELIDRNIFGVDERTSISPQGLGYSCTSGRDFKAAAAVPTLAKIESLVEDLIKGGGYRDPLWITSPTGALILRKTPVIPPSADPYCSQYLLKDDNKMLGIPLIVCPDTSDEAGSDRSGSLLVLGNFQDICLTIFGGIIVTVDPLTRSHANTIRIIVQMFMDVKGLRGTLETDAEPDTPGEPESQPYEYARAVVCTAIK